MSKATGAAGLLSRQFKEMQTAKDLPGISCGLLNDNVFTWEVMLMISDDCKYYGGMSTSPPSITPPSLPPDLPLPLSPFLHCHSTISITSIQS